MTYLRRYPFSRSYGVILPSSLTRVLPSVFVFSTYPPASDCGTGTLSLDSSFSRQRDIYLFLTYFQSASLLNLMVCVLHCIPVLQLARSFPSLRQASPSVSLHLSNGFGGIGIFTDCPSPTAFALGLGPDLPWVDDPSPGNLGYSTAQFLTSLSLLIPAFSLVFCPLDLTVSASSFIQCSPTNRLTTIPKLRCRVLAPVHLRRIST